MHDCLVHLRRHCEERFLRRGNLEVIDFCKTEIASLRSQRRQKYFFNSLLKLLCTGSVTEIGFIVKRNWHMRGDQHHALRVKSRQKAKAGECSPACATG